MAKSKTKRINVALQGGGAHGAFTWGVLDRFLDEENLEIDGISGTSAGALNGAAYKSGWLDGGREGARSNLDWLWNRMGALRDLHGMPWLSNMTAAFTPSPAMTSATLDYSLPYAMLDATSRVVSPYAMGPFYKNPLVDVAEEFRFDKVCSHDGPRLYIGATNVRSGKIRVFTHDEITPDALLASACLPEMFQAIEIYDPATERKEAYWDGGYSGNPALFPLFGKSLPDDIIVVNINPIHREDLPVTPQQIANRVNEISFNSSLLRELRAIAFVQRLIDDGKVTKGAMKRVNVHMVADDALMNALSVATKLLPQPALLLQLKQKGRDAADRFLAQNWDALNSRSTVDLAEMLN
ncbi:MAG: patatin-like phospholipase family protein [Paracoccaceae bacterium]